MKFTKQVCLSFLSITTVVAQSASSSSLRRGDEDGPKQRKLQEVPDSYGMEPPSPTYLITLNQSEKSQIDDLMSRLGASILYYNAAASFALVTGLSDTAVADALASDFVETVDKDELLDFGGPEMDVDGLQVESEGFPDAEVQSPSNPAKASRYAWQWNMRAIAADKAWAAGRLGSGGVTVAILDTGIDYAHIDLVGRVDLSRSVSFVPQDDTYVKKNFKTKHLITDLHYHGTHVAATVASNGYATAGVTSKTTLIGIKVCNANGSCSFGAVIAGILHAVDAGAAVANMSLGGGFLKNQNPGLVGYINKVYNYANSKKMLIVVSAGNASEDLDKNGAVYQTYCDTPSTMCVSATGPQSSDNINTGPFHEVDAPAYYTNYGTSAVDVAAPGGSSGGVVWAACSSTSLKYPTCRSSTSYILGLRGTSMAAPHVSGLAALVVEDVGRNPGRVKSIIRNSADDLGKNGADPYYGKGRINVANAVGA